MQITIAVPTHNRFAILQKMAMSLSLTVGLDRPNIHVRIFDDASDEYNIATLKQLFPYATSITARKENLGANANMLEIYRDFLETDDEVFVHAESDLLCHPQWLGFVESMMHMSDGILSVYNSEQIPDEGKIVLGEKTFILKPYLGAIGVVLTRQHIETIVENCPATSTFDWDWSRFLRERGYRLLTSERSWFQHIGLDGFNSRSTLYVDFGRQFYPGHPVVETYLVEYYDTLLSRNDAIVREHIAKELEVTQKYIRAQEIACVIGSVFLPILRPINALLKLTPFTRRVRESLIGYLTRRLPW